MHALIEQILSQGPVVTDGAWGTQLQVRGLPIGTCPDEWNLSQPDRVVDVARAYVAAGCRIILTNTFGANRIRLGEFGLADKAVVINERGVSISRRAAGNGVCVFASIGPSGKLLVAGDVTEQALLVAFTEQAEALKAGGADGLVIETMSELREAQIALAAAKTTGLPVVACLTFDTDGRSRMGILPGKAAVALTEGGADAIGSNCGNGIAGFLPICRQLRTATNLPIWLKANAGLPEYEAGRLVYRITPQEFAAYMPDLIEAGANFIGGCCGTTPAHLREVVATVNARP